MYDLGLIAEAVGLGRLISCLMGEQCNQPFSTKSKTQRKLKLLLNCN